MDLSRFLKKYDFEGAYIALKENGFCYTLNNLITVFPKCNSQILYMFLMYSISKEETVEKHVAACECLIYINPYIYDSTSMVRWHIMKAISLKNGKEIAMSWAIEVYGEDPSSPFSSQELQIFAKYVIVQDPSNQIAKAILNLT